MSLKGQAGSYELGAAAALVIELTEQSDPAADPVLFRLVWRQHHADDEVGRVTGGGQHPTPLAGLVDWTPVHGLVGDVRLPARLQPHLQFRNRFRSVRFLTCAFRASCYSMCLLWAHTPVINWAVWQGQMVSSNSVRGEGERRRCSGHTPIHWVFKNQLGWSWYWDVNPVPTSPLADDITTAPSGLVNLEIKNISL